MDVIVTRKIGYPRQPELGVGAIAEGLREPVYDARLVDRLGLAPEDLAEVVAAEQAELDRRGRGYRRGGPPPPPAGRGGGGVGDRPPAARPPPPPPPPLPPAPPPPPPPP